MNLGKVYLNEGGKVFKQQMYITSYNSLSVPVDAGSTEKKKKKRSRWGKEDKKMVIPGMPTILPPNLNPDQQKAYVCKFVFI